MNVAESRAPYARSRHAAPSADAARAAASPRVLRRIHPPAGDPPDAPETAASSASGAALAARRLLRGVTIVRLRAGFCAAAALLALTALAGWIGHIEALKNLLPGATSMKVNTALPLLALAFALWPDGPAGTAGTALPRLRLAAAAAAAALAAAILAEYLLGLALGIDELVFSDPDTTSPPYPGRSSPAAAAAVLFLGAAVMMLRGRRRWCAGAAHWLAAPAAAIGAVALTGYAYGGDQFYDLRTYVSVPLGSALALCALAAATLLARARESWQHVLTDRPGAGAVFARLMPASFVLPFAGGLVVLFGVRAGFYAPTFGISIFAVLMIATLIALSWETAFVAARVEGALQRSNAGLLAARLRAEDATRAKTRFLAGMSHELRTPLHAILGYAELLAGEADLPAQQRTRIVAMLGTGRHLLATINSVLTMSEIESGRVELRPAAIDLKPLAADCIDLVRPHAEAKGLAVTVEAAPDLPAAIVADATRLRQILVNLLGNAVKFTDRGHVQLRLRRAPPDGPLAGVSIEIADTGPGIPTERRPALFQEFERLDRDRDSRIEGAGLGLAIAARLAALMHGSISYAENPGGGSIFLLSLPAAPPDPSCLSARLPPDLAQLATDSPRPFVPRRVLIVDDVQMNRDIAAAFLRSAGHAVIAAATGEAAVTEAARHAFDVVLMDVRMGEMDGFEATRRIRALGGACRQLPIIAMTAHVFADQIEACARAGMDFHLPKPFGQAAILAAIETALDWQNTGLGAQTGPAPAAGAALPVIDIPRFDTIAAYFSASSMVTYLQRLAAGIEALTDILPTLDPAAAVSTETADAVHALAGKAGMLGFGRLALSASQFETLARSGEDGLAVPIAALLTDLRDALAETLARLADLGVQSA